ncbi:MAG: PAS domain S-box protein [Desulfohalobiaceae bacterium]
MYENPTPSRRELALFHAVDELVMTLDSDLRIQWANQRAGKMVDEAPESLVGRPCYQAFHGREVSCGECPVPETMRTEAMRETDKKAPNSAYQNIRSYPLYSQEGDLEGVAVLGVDISRRKQEGQEREERKRFGELVTDNMSDLVSLADLRGNIEFAGRSHEILGYDPDALIGTNVLDLVHPKDKPYVRNELDTFLRSPSNGYKVEYRCVCRNNFYLWFETIAQIVEDENFQEPKILFSTRDITSRKWSEEHNRFLSTLIENIYDSVVVTDSSFRITYINKRAEELSGYKLEEVKGLSAFSFHADPGAPETQKQLHEAVTSGESYIGEGIKQRKDGSTFVCEFRVMPLRDSHGHIYAHVGIQRDITERKQAEEALQRSESYYRTLFETSGAAIYIVEEDTTISDVNSHFEELVGYSREEINGRMSALDFVHPEDVPTVRENHFQRRSDPQAVPRQYEYRLITRYGSTKHICVSVDMIPGTSRSVVSIIDITERKQMEERLKELSVRDALTGLYNRNFFEEEMERLSDGRYSPVGIVVCDLDGLKFVNDTLGHQSGDRLLLKAADLLRANFRNSDIIARIGGDEFAILFPETDWQMVELMLQRFQQAVRDYNNADPEIPISLSVGQAVGEKTGPDIYALFREADNRMYREKLQRKGSARSAILQALTVSMEARDFKTEGHCDRLLALCVSLSRELGLSQDLENDLCLLARFHDLGKVGIPDHILFKPVPLTEEEWRQMSQHCEIGHRIASSVPDLKPIADLILKHHERWDGRGYPLGVSGRDIPLACRILAIADAYDALTSDRPYQEALPPEKAINELRRCAGTHFDPELVERFIGIVGQ